jgi:hypothetical protein
VQLDQRHAPSEPVDVCAFARWAASASLDGALAAEGEAMRDWFGAQLGRRADIALDALRVEAPQEVLLRRVAEEVCAYCVTRDDLDESEVPIPAELELAGVSMGAAALDELPVHNELGLERSALESVALSLADQAERKRTARGREDVNLSAALLSKRARDEAADDDAPDGAEEAGAFLDEHEVLLRVHFFHARRPAKLRELVLAGSQTLGDLREMLSCDAERMVATIASKRELEDARPSRASAFLIGRRLYTDVVDGVDVSAQLRAWLDANDPDGAVVDAGTAAAPMRIARLDALVVTLGAQNLFVHLGECEHVVVFTDLWLRTRADEPRRSAYPRLLFEARRKVERCFVCKQHAARQMTVGSSSYLARLGVHNPSCFCEQCYHALHYDARDNRLLHDDFRTYELELIEEREGDDREEGDEL